MPAADQETNTDLIEAFVVRLNNKVTADCVWNRRPGKGGGRGAGGQRHGRGGGGEKAQGREAGGRGGHGAKGSRG